MRLGMNGGPARSPGNCFFRVSRRGWPGPINSMSILRWRPCKQGMSLIELLCVIGIISILAALYLGGIAKAFLHVKKVLGGLGH